MTPDEFALTIISGIVVAISVLGFGYAIKFFQTKNSRKSYLITIKKQLENDERVFDDIKEDLENSNIPSNFDTGIYRSFLSSEYYNPEKDSDFVEKLQGHLTNIGRYQTALQRINLLSASTTGSPTNLEKAVIVSIRDMSDSINRVIIAIEKLIN